VAGTVAAATPAQADMSIMNTQQCAFGPPFYFCQTGVLPANPGHWIKVTVWPPRVGLVECSLYDSANYVRVGYVSRSSQHLTYTTQTVNGLYASYYLICTNNDKYGAGAIFN
jgi:hypothetical protein